MELKHEYIGELTGNPSQSVGRHRDGIGFIPLGSRTRDVEEYGEDYLEERMSIDKYTKYIE